MKHFTCVHCDHKGRRHRGHNAKGITGSCHSETDQQLLHTQLRNLQVHGEATTEEIGRCLWMSSKYPRYPRPVQHVQVLSDSLDMCVTISSVNAVLPDKGDWLAVDTKAIQLDIAGRYVTESRRTETAIYRQYGCQVIIQAANLFISRGTWCGKSAMIPVEETQTRVVSVADFRKRHHNLFEVISRVCRWTCKISQKSFETCSSWTWNKQRQCNLLELLLVVLCSECQTCSKVLCLAWRTLFTWFTSNGWTNKDVSWLH